MATQGIIREENGFRIREGGHQDSILNDVSPLLLLLQHMWALIAIDKWQEVSTETGPKMSMEMPFLFQLTQFPSNSCISILAVTIVFLSSIPNWWNSIPGVAILSLLCSVCNRLWCSFPADTVFLADAVAATANEVLSQLIQFLLLLMLFSVLRIRDVYPGSWFLPIPDPGSRISDPGSQNSNKREGGKKFVVIPFYVATNFTKLKLT